MGDQPLSLPRVRVLRDGQDPLEIQILNPDLLRWDVTRGKHRWGTMKDSPNLWMTFIAWAAMTRTGLTSQTWETFMAETLEVLPVTETEGDPAGPGVADPFPQDPGPE
jgi:hypothetical protein